MALGTLGSTLNDELNRLANGGTYRTMDQMVDEALAAKQWANRENINPYSTDTVGVLNEIAGLGTNRQNWLDFNGVCNYIAGTTGLPAAAALRQVYPTTDLLTGVASYYVDATAPTNWGSLGYVRLPGVSGNFLSVPDSSALDITGDIDIRARVSLDSWTTAQAIIAKYENGTGNFSWTFQCLADGTLRFTWSANGTAVNSATSTVATGLSAGTVKWIRATLDVDNGASGRDIRFFTSDDGSSWTQLGTTVTSAGVTSIFNSNSNVTLGRDGSATNMAGNLYRAQVLNGIGGTTVLDVNIATDYRSSDQSFFTATTGQTVTVNGVDTIANLGAAGSLLPTTLGSSTATDSNDPKFLDFTGTNYVYLPGVAQNTLSVPDSNDLDITGDIDIRWYGALDDWTPSSAQTLASKNDGTSNSWRFDVNTTGVIRFIWTTDGLTANQIVKSSTVAPTIADGALLWVRVTLDVDNGASGNDVKFFTSTDGTTWTQLGSTVTTAGVTSIWAGIAPVEIGSYGSRAVGNMAGKVFRAQIFNGIDGTKVLDVDTSVITAGSATSFTAVTGQTVTINRSTSGRKTVAVTQPTWLFGTDDYMEVNNRYMSSGTYLYLPGVASNYASTPDAAALDITGDIDIRVKVAMDDWTPSANSALLYKWDNAGLSASYGFRVNATTGVLIFLWTANGSTVNSAASTVAPTITDGSTLWVRATLDVDNGASGNTVTFFTSTDGTTWTQLGNTVTQAGVTSIFSGTGQLEVGSFAGGTSPARGKFFRAQVLNGIGGTVAFDANFETSITSLNQASFTESSANAATVTINRSGSAYRSAGITAAGYLYPGATNTFTASATDHLNFGASDSFTALVVARNWVTTNDAMFMAKSINGISATMVGYTLYNNTTGSTGQLSARIGDGTNRIVPTAIDNISGANKVVLLIRNVASDTVNAYINTTTTSASDTTTGSLSNIATLQIGTNLGGSFQPMEFYAAAVFRQALTATQIRQIVNYFANREVYL